MFEKGDTPGNVSLLMGKRFMVLLLGLGMVSILIYGIRFYRDNSQKNFSIGSVWPTRIEIVSENDTLTLSFHKNTWYVNQTYLADSSAVNQFIEMIRGLNAFAPATSYRSNDLAAIEENAYELKFYKKSRLVKHFYIAFIPKFNYKPVGLHHGAKQAFYIESSLVADDMYDYLSVSPNQWLAARLFPEPIDSISEIRISYPADSASSYTIDFLGNQIRVFDSSSRQETKFDIARISLLYHSFENIRLRVATREQQKSAVRENILATVEILMSNDKRYSFKLYRIAGDSYTNILGQSVKFDPDRLMIHSAEFGYLTGSYLDFHYILYPW